MLKRIISFAGFLLVMSSCVFAGTTQDQGATIGATNTVQLLHGDQTGDSMQNLLVQADQDGGPDVVEHLFGAIGQIGSAWGECGLVGVVQTLGVLGTQGQQIGDCCDPKSSLHTLDLIATQGLSKAGGAGGASGLHTIVLNGEQAAANAGGTMNGLSTAMGMQTSDISGGPGATGTVQTGMSVMGSQTQAAM